MIYLQNKAKVVFSPKRDELSPIEKGKLTRAQNAVKKYEKKERPASDKKDMSKAHASNPNFNQNIPPDFLLAQNAKKLEEFKEQVDKLKAKKLERLNKQLGIQPDYIHPVEKMRASTIAQRKTDTPIKTGRSKNKPKSAKEDD